MFRVCSRRIFSRYVVFFSYFRWNAAIYLNTSTIYINKKITTFSEPILAYPLVFAIALPREEPLRYLMKHWTLFLFDVSLSLFFLQIILKQIYNRFQQNIENTLKPITFWFFNGGGVSTTSTNPESSLPLKPWKGMHCGTVERDTTDSAWWSWKRRMWMYRRFVRINVSFWNRSLISTRY